MSKRALLDTNIVIHREAATVIRADVGVLFNWFDKLGILKCIHPITRVEIEKHQDERVRNSFRTKLDSYHELKSTAPVSSAVKQFETEDDSENHRNDTRMLNKLCANRVDFLITEDKALLSKAIRTGMGSRAYTIEGFLEKANAENPNLADYKVLAVKKTFFGRIRVEDPFFDSFRDDYGGLEFNSWFNRKSDETAYACFEGEQLVAFLYLKVESDAENYSSLVPQFLPAKRLKIGTFKVVLNGFKIGERFLKIVFDNAIRQRVSEIYVTAFGRGIEQQRLIAMLQEFGFQHHGVKKNSYGDEQVFVRNMAPRFAVSAPRSTFPFIGVSGRHFLVPIYPEYHTNLLPDSILNNESPAEFVEHAPHRNAIKKVYISRSYFRDLLVGDIIVFYRTGGIHKSVVTTLGIVEEVHANIPDAKTFVQLCRRRSVFTDIELEAHWNYNPADRPFIVSFLYAYSFPKRPNMKALIENGVIRDVNSAPRGFQRLAPQQFQTILDLSTTDKRIVVN